MRWFLLLILLVCGSLFLIACTLPVKVVHKETPTAPIPVVPWPIFSTPISPATPTPLPPEERIKGRWIRIGGPERLEFKDDSTVSRKLSWYIYDYFYRDYYYSIGDDRIDIVWGREGTRRTFVKLYSYELTDNTLILTEDNGNRFIYLRDSEPIELGRQATESIGPNPVTISGRLVGPEGVLANQLITLKHYNHCSLLTAARFGGRCPEEVTTTTTDATGQYKFLDVEPEGDYGLTFVFSVADLTQISDGAVVGSFVLSKAGGLIIDPSKPITATSNSFYLSGFESEKTIDFIYPSSPPPTATPRYVIPTLSQEVIATIASRLTPSSTPMPTSTPTFQPTPTMDATTVSYDFNDPKFEGTFDKEQWASGGVSPQIEQQNGALVFTLASPGPGVHAFWLSPTRPQSWTLDQFQFIEARLRLRSETEPPTSGFESFDLGLIAPLINNRELTFHCSIVREELVKVKCGTYIWEKIKQEAGSNYEAYVKPTNFDSWHTVRIEIDLEVNVTFSIDGQRSGSYRPQEAGEVKDGPFSPRIWIYSTTPDSLKGYVDDVRIGQIGP